MKKKKKKKLFRREEKRREEKIYKQIEQGTGMDNISAFGTVYHASEVRGLKPRVWA